jgi:putrescine transport system substrate-binding protein
MIKHAFSGVALAAMLTVGTAGGAGAADQELRIFNWSDYIDTSIIEDFTKETGIKVVYDVYDSMEILETKMLAGGSGYDIVVPTDRNLMRMIEVGVFQKLDKSKIPNLSHMWDEITTREATYDPGNEYAVNYMWGTTGLGYNTRKVEDALGVDKIDSWSVLFDPQHAAKLADCGIYVLDSPTDVVPSVLAWLGLDPNSTEDADLAKAEEALLAVRPYIRKFHSSEYINALANGDICLAVGYSGDVFQARDRAAEADQGVDVGYAIPKEGAQMWFDQMAIPADAPHVAEAHEFINYILRPEVAAKASNYVFYANGNKASQEFLDPELKNDPAVYPDDATMQKLFTLQPLDTRAQRKLTRLWTKVLTGQ